MKKIDARTLSQDTQETLRWQIITLRTAGRLNKEVAEIVGVSEAHCSRVWARYRNKGAEAVAKGRRGRRHGDKRRLTGEQEATIIRILINRFPHQVDIGCALWNSAAIQLLIKQKYGIHLSIRTVDAYLKRWGITPCKPGMWDKNQNSPVQGNDYAAIARRASAEKGVICRGGEASILITVSEDKGTCLNGNTMETERSSEMHGLTLMYAVTKRRKVSFMVYQDTNRSKRVLSFMGRIIRDAGQKVFLIFNSLKFFRSGQARKWLAKRQDKIEVLYLPTCLISF